MKKRNHCLRCGRHMTKPCWCRKLAQRTARPTSNPKFGRRQRDQLTRSSSYKQRRLQNRNRRLQLRFCKHCRIKKKTI